MSGGCTGKVLNVNLTTGKITEEAPEEKLYRDFLGGHGLGARILYSRQSAGVDPLGPDNTFGLVTGVLTGTPAVFGARYIAVARSPLTGDWGDANSGGFFGPTLKMAGYDAVFFSGVSEKPVYLLVDNGKAELKDASSLWGQCTDETETALQEEYGKNAHAVTIGPAGEKQALIAAIMNHRGDAAGRSGLGAVMGSKKLKAVVARGDMKVPVHDAELADRLRKEHIAALPKPFLEGFHTYGTAGHADASAHSGDSPVRNWGGVGVRDLPDVSGLHKDVIGAGVERRTGCWRCPVACKAHMKESGRHPAGALRPEYETLAAFGSMCLNGNAEVITAANHICNSYGLDTISTGTTIAFAMECYEHGIISKADADGMELKWGDGDVIVALAEKIGKREGIGDLLADGVQAAARKLGKKAEEYAVHIGGQELGLHDPKFDSPIYRGKFAAAMYHMDATPGRHTTGFGPTQFPGHVLSASGYCMHGAIAVADPYGKICGYISAVTGWDFDKDEMMVVGERIANIRHAFTLREGVNPLERYVHGRIFGYPPQAEGPLAGVSADYMAQAYWNLGALDWDMHTTRPSKQKLLSLGLDDVAADLWPEEPKGPGGH